MLKMACYRWSIFTSLFFLVTLCGLHSFEYKTYIVPGINPFYKPPRLQGFSASGRQPSRCTSKDLPCYDAILTYVRDGICNFTLSDPNFFFEHFAKLGQGSKGIIAAGKKAADFIFKQTGFDFRHLPDEAFINTVVSTQDGSVTFQPGHFTPECKYRLTTLEVGGKVQFINKLVSTIGWSIQFNKETRVYGALDTVIPQDSLIGFGNYVILPCEKGKDDECQSLYNPKDPYAPIVIEWSIRDWLTTSQPRNFRQLDLDLFSEEFGTGRGLGIIYPDEIIEQAEQVLRFPPRVDDNKKL